MPDLDVDTTIRDGLRVFVLDEESRERIRRQLDDYARSDRRDALIGRTRARLGRNHPTRIARVAIASISALILLTGIAAAADDRVADAIGDAGGTIMSIFTGEPSSTPPSSAAIEMLERMEANHGSGDPLAAPDGRVLLHETVDGHEIEIVAAARPEGSPSSHGPSKQDEACFAVTVDGEADHMICTTDFQPGLPINYGMGQESGPNFRDTYSISGLAADNVEGITVVTPEGDHPVTMGDNAFWWQTADAEQRDIRPTHLEIHLTDGRTIRDAIRR